jgi:hypothetical protein
LLIFSGEALRNSLLRYEEIRRITSIRTRFCPDLARILITEIAKVSAPKNKENAPAAGESGNQRPKRRKDKLIRLNDLIPKQDVTSGQRLLFGVTDKTQSTNKPKGN